MIRTGEQKRSTRHTSSQSLHTTDAGDQIQPLLPAGTGGVLSGTSIAALFVRSLAAAAERVLTQGMMIDTRQGGGKRERG